MDKRRQTNSLRRLRLLMGYLSDPRTERYDDSDVTIPRREDSLMCEVRILCRVSLEGQPGDGKTLGFADTEYGCEPDEYNEGWGSEPCKED
jgi:hypothetical protein